MDLRAYLSILKRRGWIILVTALLAMILAGGLSLLQTKTYRATARISAVPARPDWGLGSSAKDLLRSFVLNINTHNMANQVISAANLDMSSYDLLAKLTVSAEPENFAIRIDADLGQIRTVRECAAGAYLSHIRENNGPVRPLRGGQFIYAPRP